jgi:hypothetical protein
MKTTIILTLATFFVFGFILPKQAAAQEEVEYYVDGREQIEGFYTLKDNNSKDFKTIDYLELRHGREEKPTYGIIKLKGKSGASYKLMLPTLKDKNISLKTKAVAGISYEFSGTFTRINLMDTSDLDSKEIVLAGKLRKMSRGKVIAEIDAQFTYYWGT